LSFKTKQTREAERMGVLTYVSNLNVFFNDLVNVLMVHAFLH